jgi:hypothetical protein
MPQNEAQTKAYPQAVDNSCKKNNLWITCEQWMSPLRVARISKGRKAWRVATVGKMTSEDYLRALDGAGSDGDADAIVYTQEGPEDSGEAERIADAAEGPKTRADGQVVGAEGWKRQRPLTAQQQAFADGVIQGKSLRQAYRDAYPNAQANDQSISATAARLMKDERIAKAIREAWEETQEALADDAAATRRYVMRSLVALSKQANQEGSRLKALELLGRSAGMWREQQAQQDKPLTAAELRAQLAGHLKLVGQTTRRKTGTGDA